MVITARLLFRPERAWSGLVDAETIGEGLPSPLGLATTLAALSVVATLVGASLDPGRSVGGVVVHGLTAIVGYEGAVLCAVFAARRILARHARFSDPLAARLGAGATMPLAASGTLNFLPLWGPTLALTLIGTVLTARSAWIGSRTLLGGSG